MLSKKVALMDLMEELKRGSSKWAKQKLSGYNDFYWQRGYGAFSIREREIPTVTRYIANQKNHHTKVPFQDEYRSILKHHNVEYDERYIWD